MRNLLLWTHVLSGALLTGAAASFVLAAATLEGEERASFAGRAALPIGRLCVGLLAVILVTGVANLAYAAGMRAGGFSRAFMAVLAAKVVLYLATAAIFVELLRAQKAPAAGSDERRSTRTLGLYGLGALLSALALALGVWLVGS